MNVTTMNNIDHSLLQQATCTLQVIKCDENVVKSNNSHNVWGWKKTRFIHVSLKV
jgi:hypothetical protein